MRRLTCIVLLVLGMSASVAFAAPPWSAPESVSSPSLFVDQPDLVLAGDGRAIATWRWSGVKRPLGEAPGGTRLAVREPGALDFGPERDAPAFVTPLVAHGPDRILGIELLRRSGNRASLRARFGSSRGEFGRPQTISTYTQTRGLPSLAQPGGEVVAWIAGGAKGRRIVRAAVRTRGRFGRPVTLRGRGRANGVVAGAARGAAFVAWERAGTIEARVKLSSRRRWSRVQVLGEAQRGTTTFAAAGSGRRGYLAWLSQAEDSAALRTAALPASKSRFMAAKPVRGCAASVPCVDETIMHAAPAEGHVVRLVALPEGDALLAWSMWYTYPGVWAVRAARTRGDSTFTGPIHITPTSESAVLSDLAANPGGAVMFVWSRLDAVDELGDRVRARLLVQESGPEDVSDLGRARLPAVAYDARANRWTTVWSQRLGPDQPGVPLDRITTYARSATRPG